MDQQGVIKQLTLGALLLSTIGHAGEADVTAVEVTATGPNTFSFRVTVQHADTGWDHYANAWDVLGPDGTVLATRKLWHPHVDEQPFTRSLSGVVVPADIKQVTLRARDSQHGYGGTEVSTNLPR